MLNNTGTLSGAGSEGNGTNGSYIWGAKLNKGDLDVYTAQSGEEFFVSNDYNIKKFIIDRAEDFIEAQLNGTHVNPAPESGAVPYYDPQLPDRYETADVMLRLTNTFNLYREQLKDTNYYVGLDTVVGITLPSTTYVKDGSRNVPVPISKELVGSDFFYGLSSNEATAKLRRSRLVRQPLLRSIRDSSLILIRSLLVLPPTTSNLVRLLTLLETVQTLEPSMLSMKMQTSAIWMSSSPLDLSQLTILSRALLTAP